MSEPLQDMREHCDVCSVPVDYHNGSITLDDARHACQYCRFGSSSKGIYKFDIAYTLYLRQPFKGKGKTATRTKQYGTAVHKLTSEGKTVRQIAEILGISPTTVVKIKKELSDK